MAANVKHFSIKVLSDGDFRATNIPNLTLRAWKVGSAYTGEITTKKGNMVLMLGMYYVLENLLKSADSFIDEYKDTISEIIKKEG